MKKRATIKDIASMAGVSIGTVHLALNHKPGVGEATREKIIALAKEMDYHPNAVAASLKRKTLRIAACFPGVDEDNRFYYPQLWNGMRSYVNTLYDYKISCREFPYPENQKSGSTDDDRALALQELTQLLEAGELDGLVIQGNSCPYDSQQLRKYTDQGLALALVDTDILESGRLCCVAADYDSIGRTMAEQILGRIPFCGSVLLCAGRKEYPSHRLIEKGFEDYMKENHHGNLVYKEHSNQIDEESYKNILDYINRPDVAGACCVSSRSSVMLGRALEESGRSKDLVAIGSDLFSENKEFLRRGTFQNLVQKNPYAQSFMATKFLMDYLLRDAIPDELFVVGSQMIFKSNISLYEKNSLRFLE